MKWTVTYRKKIASGRYAGRWVGCKYVKGTQYKFRRRPSIARLRKMLNDHPDAERVILYERVGVDMLSPGFGLAFQEDRITLDKE